MIDFKVFGPYSKGAGTKRKIVIVVYKDGRRRTVSYPKWIMEQHLGRELGIDETVDHWDTDIDNNDLSNLSVINRSEHSANDTRRVDPIELECPWCGELFSRQPRKLRERAKSGQPVFCSKSCAGKYSRFLQLKLIDAFAPAEHVESVYYKRKYKDAVASDIDDEVLSFENLSSMY